MTRGRPVAGYRQKRCLSCEELFSPKEGETRQYHDGECQRCPENDKCKCNLRMKSGFVCNSCEFSGAFDEMCCRYDSDE